MNQNFCDVRKSQDCRRPNCCPRLLTSSRLLPGQKTSRSSVASPKFVVLCIVQAICVRAIRTPSSVTAPNSALKLFKPFHHRCKYLRLLQKARSNTLMRRTSNSMIATLWHQQFSSSHRKMLSSWRRTSALQSCCSFLSCRTLNRQPNGQPALSRTRVELEFG